MRPLVENKENLGVKRKRELTDYGNDMDTVRCCKRGCLCSSNSELNYCTCDEQEVLYNVKIGEVMADIDFMDYLKANCGEENVDDDSLEDEMDPDYKMFLEHSREDGTSYIFEMAREDGMSVFIKYEEENESFDKVMEECPRNSGSISSRPRRSARINKDLKSDFMGPSSFDEHKKITEELDESYCLFMSSIKVHGVSIVLETEDGVRVRYEDEDEGSTDPEVLPADITLDGDERESTPSNSSNDSSRDEDGWSHIASPDGSKPCQFREKLFSVLRMPFDKKEYDKLWKLAVDRKPLQRHRELRGRLVPYATAEKSFSYLDYHDDLKEVIEIIGDNQVTVLKLLRGFFFWLKNVAHAGAFEPWLDQPCLKMMLSDH